MSAHPDKALILAYGGPTKVAKMLGYDQKPGGPQRVQNWMRRGIPSDVKVTFPHLFLQPVAALPATGDPDSAVVS